MSASVVSDDDQVVVVYATFPDLATAEKIGGELVTKKRAACVNILPGMRSIYQWKGAVEMADEVVMIIKTRASVADAVMAEVVERHPYETPALLVLDVSGGHAGYMAWLLAETEVPPPAS